MMRSLYSAVSGLKSEQIAMDVIGNNIANVNTIGYKASRVNFSTLLSQTLAGASAPDQAQTAAQAAGDYTVPAAYGGTNNIQIGLGTSVGSIDQMFKWGSAQNTDSPTDMMINGDGMFVVKDRSGNTYYTRNGNFGWDPNGNLVDRTTGALVQGITADDDGKFLGDTDTDGDGVNDILGVVGNICMKNGMTYEQITGHADPATTLDDDYKLTGYSIDPSGIITGTFTRLDDPTTAGVNEADSQSRQLFQINIAGFANYAGLTASGSNYYSASNNSGKPVMGVVGVNGLGSIQTSALEMSNVDLSTEFTNMIVTQRGFQANSRVITVSDTLLQELIDLKRG